MLLHHTPTLTMDGTVIALGTVTKIPADSLNAYSRTWLPQIIIKNSRKTNHYDKSHRKPGHKTKGDQGVI